MMIYLNLNNQNVTKSEISARSKQAV